MGYLQNVEWGAAIKDLSTGRAYQFASGVIERIEVGTFWTVHAYWEARHGHWEVWFHVDPANKIQETNKDNNIVRRQFFVQERPFDFEISVSPSEREIRPGETTTFDVTVEPVDSTVLYSYAHIPWNGCEALSADTSTVDLSLSGDIDDTMSYDFSQPSGQPLFSSTLTITTSKETPKGRYQLTITGQGEGVSHSATVYVTVERAKEPSEISLSVDPRTVVLGDMVKIRGTLSPGRPMTEIKLMFMIPGGGVFVTTTTTNRNGDFEVSHILDKEGDWTVQAIWQGDEDYLRTVADVNIKVVVGVKLKVTLKPLKDVVRVGSEFQVRVTVKNIGLVKGEAVTVWLSHEEDVPKESRIWIGDVGSGAEASSDSYKFTAMYSGTGEEKESYDTVWVDRVTYVDRGQTKTDQDSEWKLQISTYVDYAYGSSYPMTFQDPIAIRRGETVTVAFYYGDRIAPIEVTFLLHPLCSVECTFYVYQEYQSRTSFTNWAPFIWNQDCHPPLTNKQLTHGVVVLVFRNNSLFTSKVQVKA